ncbi:unnamed protein product [Closterium sp. NIES-53]
MLVPKKNRLLVYKYLFSGESSSFPNSPRPSPLPPSSPSPSHFPPTLILPCWSVPSVVRLPSPSNLRLLRSLPWPFLNTRAPIRLQVTLTD